MADVLYLGNARCLHRLPVPQRQKVVIGGSATRLHGVHDIVIVEVCPSEWPHMSQSVADALRILHLLGVETHAVDCLSERERLVAEAHP